MAMKLPEFQGTRQMSLQATSSKAQVDRTREFQTKAQIGQQVNQFSEELEKKRYAANVDEFRRKESTETKKEWMQAQQQLALHTRADGSVDVLKLQDTGNPMWGTGDEFTDDRYDTMVNNWWGNRVAKGKSNANNDDQAASYVRDLESNVLKASVNATNFYNSQRTESRRSSFKAESDETRKYLLTGDTLPDTEELYTELKKLQFNIKGAENIEFTPQETEALNKELKHDWAISIANNTQRIYNIAKEKGDTDTMKKASGQFLQFIRGLHTGKEKPEVEIEQLMSNSDLGARAAKDAFNSIDPEVKAKLNLEDINLGTVRSFKEEMNFRDPLTIVAGDLLGDALTPEEQMQYLQRAALMAIKENVYSEGDTARSAGDLIAAARSGDIDPKSPTFSKKYDADVRNVVNKTMESPSLSNVAKTQRLMSLIRAEEVGHLKRNMSMMSTAEAEAAIGDFENSISIARENAKKKYPKAKAFFGESFDQANIIRDKNELRSMKAAQNKALNHDSATYFFENSPEMQAMAQGAVADMASNNAAGAKRKMSQYQNSVRAKAREMGVPDSKVTVMPNSIKQWYVDQFSKADDTTGNLQASFFTFSQGVLGDAWETSFDEIVDYSEMDGNTKIDRRAKVLGYLYDKKAMADVAADIKYDSVIEGAFKNRSGDVSEVSQLMKATMSEFRSATAGKSNARAHTAIGNAFEESIKKQALFRMANNTDLKAADAVKDAYARVVESSYSFAKSGKSLISVPSPVSNRYPQIVPRTQEFISKHDELSEIKKFDIQVPREVKAVLRSSFKGISDKEIKDRYTKQLSNNISWRKSPDKPGLELMMRTAEDTHWYSFGGQATSEYEKVKGKDGVPIFKSWSDIATSNWK